jgi:RNA polymerase sigma-70 factor (ECF subfamily)
MSHEDFTAAHSEYSSMVRTIIYKMTKGDLEADDLIGETWARAWAARASLRGAIKAWLVSIAMNTVRDYWRRGKMQRRYFQDGAEVPDLGMPPVDPLTDLLVAEALDRLDERSVSVLILRHLNGYSIQEVAELMGLREENVKTITQRAIWKVNSRVPRWRKSATAE